MSSYHIAVNVEWTSKCNALCPMCPRGLIEYPQLMTGQTWRQVLDRLTPQDVFRAVIAGYGEPTTHTKFFEFVDDMRGHPIRFDMVSNGHQLDAERIRHLDGAIDLLLISFSSIDPAVYNVVHANLDQARVMDNIRTAQQLFKHTKLAISLNGARTENEFAESVTGLLDQSFDMVGVDVTYAANDKVSLMAGYVYETYFFDMAAAYSPRGLQPPFDAATPSKP